MMRRRKRKNQSEPSSSQQSSHASSTEDFLGVFLEDQQIIFYSEEVICERALFIIDQVLTSVAGVVRVRVLLAAAGVGLT